jgi:predicted RNA-binding protein with PIN domain
MATNVYHVTSRGDRREPIYVDDADRAEQLAVLAQAAERFDAQVLAYCLRRWGQVLSLASIRSTTSRAVTMAMP